jgi:hypothetical protein
LNFLQIVVSLAANREVTVATVEPQPELGSYAVGPPLPAELPKPPFTPGAAGRIAFFFGPLAGALVTAISLRRMKLPEKARTVASFSLLAAFVEAALLIITPDPFPRVIGLLTEAACYGAFKSVQSQDFEAWRAENPDLSATSGWKAVGWGLLGLILFLLILLMVGFLLGLFGVRVE